MEKKKRYWLRAWMLGLLIGVLVVVFEFIYSLHCSGWFCGLVFLFPIGLLGDPSEFLFDLVGSDFQLPTIILLNVFLTAAPFLVGGWFYGIIKNRGKLQALSSKP